MTGRAEGATEPLVTVIIPTHNRRELLERAVGSVRRQTHRAMEIIVADDASSDGTADAVREWIAEDTRIRYVRREENIGAATIRNVALAVATGRYVCFLDDDDEWLPEKVATQIPLADRYSIVGCRSRRVDGFEVLGVATARRRERQGSGRLIEVGLDDIFFNNGRLSPSCIMVTTERLRQVGGFDENLVSSQGRDLFVRLVEAFGPAVLLDSYLAAHHQRHGLVRITTTRKNLVGGWAELDKHWHLMSPSLRAWRTFVLCLKEADLAPTYPAQMGWIARSLLYVRPRRLGSYIKTFARKVFVR
ncbi:glycosyltransferase family 2 protein [Spectribacter hydrogenoxidans]|uniref:Glycosyltransferase family 2 protein n=1 Tax=Spectribacter hydrogenoxidans TaxID=3075608 RepID=A0ABU3C4P3_9GAMM|nr:glycosyltransferase family 2 protein [Salinisphaera sp. W335]MDT0636366.1 glycosyltransferase family 2 protein [Salinisphaera sp. W335]